MEEFYINFATYKVKDFGIQINNELIYTKNFGEYNIYHLPTGLKIKSGKKLKSLINEVIEKMETDKEHVDNMIANTNLKSLPTKNKSYSKEREIIVTLKIKEIPIDNFIFATQGVFKIDFVQLDKILMKNKEYSNDLSMNENIIKMYGKDFLYTLDNYNNNPFETAS
ncbi:hypothetical protein [Lysinibacillus sp. Bpr_S20]|uniref:hypothetical protein n=1 Tax=Lysinibacillus sp. Bpr_S20 TaxID=2933964 RepID=UPI002012C817|nr:hypothetical protein [Lysinibacillus sp. Bpr_S20]MCL1700813.1 hypothetical protein [Lysinibacillus sp. Bpr_S20]